MKIWLSALSILQHIASSTVIQDWKIRSGKLPFLFLTENLNPVPTQMLS